MQRFGLRQMIQSVHDLGRFGRSIEGVRGADRQRELLTDRVQAVIAQVAGDIRDATKDVPKDDRAAQAVAVSAVFNANQHKLIEAARAHGELLQWEAFTEALTRFTGETLQVMTWLRDLFGMTLLERHAAWHLVNGRMTGQRVEAVSAYIDRLISRLREHALDLVDAFGFTPGMLRAEIATGIEAERQEEARAYVEAQQAAGTWPVHEKELRAQEKAAAGS